MERHPGAQLLIGAAWTLGLCLALAPRPAWAVLRHMPKLNAALVQSVLASEAAQEALDTRLTHAKELLGKYYKRSVVAMESGIGDLKDFVQDRVSEAFQGKNRKYARKVYKAILEESEKHGFDPIFLMAVIENESSFKPKIRGKDGEIGLMQILPSTGKWIAKKTGIKWRGKRTLEDPVTNIRLGAAYLALLREEFDSHGRLYLAAYNMGSTNVQRALARDVWPKEYPSRVMHRYVRFYRELLAESGAIKTTASQ